MIKFILAGYFVVACCALYVSAREFVHARRRHNEQMKKYKSTKK